MRLSVYFEDFDLAGCRVEVFCVLSTVSLGERVQLDPEGDALLSTVLPGSKLCADAVHLRAARRREDTGAINARVWCGNSEARTAEGTKESGDVCVWGLIMCSTCTNTDVLLFKSHRNSAALSWEEWVFGSTMPTDMGISVSHTRGYLSCNSHTHTRESWSKHFSAGMYRCQGDGRQDDSTSSPPAAGAPCTAAVGHETLLALCSTDKHTC